MRRSSGRAAFGVIAAVCAVTAGGAHACRAPTQVTVEIGTLGLRCDELKRVSVVVASSPGKAEESAGYPQVEVTQCDGDHRVGTLVLTPSESSGAVIVLASYTGAKCVPPKYEGCIVARRAFAFIDGVPLRLPITLEASCKDVPCEILSSCRSGTCVTSAASCEEDGTCTAPAEPVVAEDGTPVPPPPDVVVDGGPPNDTGAPDVVKPPVDGGLDSSLSFNDSGKGTTYGNGCPAEPPGPDCFASGMVCCASTQFSCIANPSSCAGSYFPCTGKLHCLGPNKYCCAPTGSISPGQARSGCKDGCGVGEVALCNTDADCPSSLLCNTTYLSPFLVDSSAPPVLKRCN